MSFHSRRKKEVDEEESVFISMTDLMISILFIIMILMAYFSLRVDPNIKMIEKSKYEKILIELAVAEEIIELRDEEIKSLELHIEILNKKIKEIEDFIKKLKNELNIVKKDRDTAVFENITYRERIIILEKMLSEQEKISLNLVELKRKNDILEQENIILQNEIDALVRKLEGTVPKNLYLDQKFLIEQNKILQTQVATLILQIRDLEENIKKLESKLEEFQRRSMETVLEAISRDRRDLLRSIEKSLRDYQIEVQVNADSGIVRFGEKALRFGSGKYEPNPSGLEVIKTLAKVLSEELPCFVLGPHTKINLVCNPNSSIIETIQIEGHTDDIPISQATINKGKIKDNLELSTLRAAETWRIVVKNQPSIQEFFNAEYYSLGDFDIKSKPGQAILSVSGYGDARLVNEGKSKLARAENRRIDLRFIMMTPRSLREADIVAERIKLGMGEN